MIANAATPPPAIAAGSPWRVLRLGLGRRETQLVLAMVVVCAISTAIHPYFLTTGNIAFILADAVSTMLLAVGQTVVILGRGIDLSVAPILGLAAVAVGFPAQNSNLPLVAALFIVLALGIALGIGNGLLVAVVGIPPIIATLATLTVYGGLQFIVSNGNQVDTLPSAYTTLGSADLLPGIPWLIVIGLVVVGAFSAFLRYTVTGRSIYALGNNADAAYRAGIPVKRLLFLTYVISGMLAGLAGLVYLCHTGTADSTTGTDTSVQLTSIAAALLGGTSLTGGRGGPLGGALGAVFLSLALTSMVFLRIPPIWEPAGVGLLILLAIVGERRRHRGARQRREAG